MKRAIQDLNLYDVRTAFVGTGKWRGTLWSRAIAQEDGVLVSTRVVLEALKRVRETHEKGAHLVEVDVEDDLSATRLTVYDHDTGLFYGITVDNGE